MKLYATGSLKAALTEVAAAFEERYGVTIAPRFAPSLSVGADYGLAVLAPGNPAAVRFARFHRSDTGQAILGEYDSDTPTQVSTNQ